jgi:restriction system protein
MLSTMQNEAGPLGVALEQVVGKQQQTFFDELHDLLKITPAWVGPVLAAGAFIVFRFLIPFALAPSDGSPNLFRGILQVMPLLGWIAAICVMAVWLMAEFDKRSSSRLLDRQTGPSSIREISWRDFEILVAEAYRRQGFSSSVVGDASGDGGVDIELRRRDDVVLVECKHWKAYKVSVTTIRELLGVVVSRKATAGIVITSGQFTQEARNFAEANSTIQLVDGSALDVLIRDVQRTTSSGSAAVGPLSSRNEAASTHTLTPLCPSCGLSMVMRTARQGQFAGSSFWGCQRYPRCRGKRKSA